MPNIKGSDGILLQPGVTSTTRTISVPVKTSVDDNKGFLLPGTAISNAVVTVTKNETAADATSDIIVTTSFTDDAVDITFKYPVVGGDGRYKIKIVLTIDNGDVEVITADRIVAVTY